METKSIIEILPSACFLPAAMFYALKAAGVEVTEEQQKTVAYCSIMIIVEIYANSDAGDITKILSDSIRRTGNRKLMAEFTDNRITEIIKDARNSA